MTNTIEIKINKTVFKFIETVYEADKGTYYIDVVQLNYQSIKIKIKIRGIEHNPAHVHIEFNNSVFLFQLKKKVFSEIDYKKTDFAKLKRKKNIYNSILEYLNNRKKELTESFYIKNPDLKNKK